MGDAERSNTRQADDHLVATTASRVGHRVHEAIQSDVLKEFKNFAMLQRRNAELARRRKSGTKAEVKINDLKRFAKDFKLSTPMPPDLKDLLKLEDTTSGVRSLSLLSDQYNVSHRHPWRSDDNIQSTRLHESPDSPHPIQSYCPHFECGDLAFESLADLEQHYRLEHNEMVDTASVYESSHDYRTRESQTTAPTTVSGVSLPRKQQQAVTQSQQFLRNIVEDHEDEEQNSATDKDAAPTPAPMPIVNVRDNASIISAASTLFTQEQKDDIVQRFSVLLWQNLRTTHVTLDEVDQTSPQYLIHQLQDALKSFSMAFDYSSSAVLERQSIKAARSVRHFRRDIAHQFYNEYLRQSQDVDSQQALEAIESTQVESVTDKLLRWESSEHLENPETPRWTIPPEQDLPGQARSAPSAQSTWSSLSGSKDSDDSNEQHARTDVVRQVYGTSIDLKGIMTILTKQPAFQGLLRFTEKLLDRYSSNKPTLIRRRVSLALRRQGQSKWKNNRGHRMIVNMGWDPVKFLTENYDQGVHQVLNRIVAVTGALEKAQLCSIGDYFKQTWPENRSALLQALTRKLRGRKAVDFRSLFMSGCVTFSDNLQVVVVDGDENFLVSIAQQLGWLAAVLTTKQDQISCAYVDFESGEWNDQSLVPVFNINIVLERPLDYVDSCWMALVGPAILACGYPIANRENNEKGLEISVPAMAALAGSPLGVTTNGAVVFKSIYWALVPVEERGESVQWHFLSHYPQKLEWAQVEEICKHQIRGKETMQTFIARRSFLALSPRFLNYLATEAYDYKAVEYSGAGQPSHWWQVNKLVMGFSQWLTLTPEMTLGKHDGILSQVPDHYEGILADAREIQVIIYDTVADRAFQTDGEELILHALLHRWVLNQEMYTNGRLSKRFPGFLDPRRSVPTSKAMQNFAEKVIFKRHASRQAPLFFKDVVKQAHCTLDAMFRETKKHNDAPLRFDIKKSSTIHGWEYMEMVHYTKNIKPKLVSLKKGCGKWQTYARDINAVVLLGANMGDVFQPLWDPPVGCENFRTLPEGRSFLAIKTETLHSCFLKQGCLRDQRRLTTSGLILQGSGGFLMSGQHVCSSFESCSEQLLMRLRSSTMRNKLPSLVPLGSSGLVLIGECNAKLVNGARPQKEAQSNYWPIKPESAANTVLMNANLPEQLISPFSNTASADPETTSAVARSASLQTRTVEGQEAEEPSSSSSLSNKTLNEFRTSDETTASSSSVVQLGRGKEIAPERVRASWREPGRSGRKRRGRIQYDKKGKAPVRL